MDDSKAYAVYFFPPALEALGEAIKPYLVEGPGGPHVLCREIDTGGSLIEMTLKGRNASGQMTQCELMVPTNMVRMIVSARSDETFGFGPHTAPVAAGEEAPGLPAIGPGAMPAEAPPHAVPSASPGPADQPTVTPPKS